MHLEIVALVGVVEVGAPRQTVLLSKLNSAYGRPTFCLIFPEETRLVAGFFVEG